MIFFVSFTLQSSEMENRKLKQGLWSKIKTNAQTQRKKYKIEDIFEQFKSKYGSKVQKPVAKPQKISYFRRSPAESNKFNTTQMSFMKDITEIRYNADMMKGEASVVSWKQEPIPQTCGINWELLEQMEAMVENWSP